MARLLALAAGLATSLAAALSPITAQAADPMGGYSQPGAYAPADDICGHRSVRSSIKSRFRHQVTHVPNLPDVGIVDLYGPALTSYQPATADSPIERRYCQATAQLSDGSNHTIWYMIEYGQGFAGIGDNVEFCMSSFDRWKVYDGQCRVLRGREQI